MLPRPSKEICRTPPQLILLLRQTAGGQLRRLCRPDLKDGHIAVLQRAACT